MTYRVENIEDGMLVVIVNNSIFFAWNPNDLDNYGLFIQKLEEKGIEKFAQMLEANPNTAFVEFCTT